MGVCLSLWTSASTNGVLAGLTGRVKTQVRPSASLVPSSRLSRSHSFLFEEVEAEELEEGHGDEDGALEAAARFAGHHHGARFGPRGAGGWRRPWGLGDV